MSKDDVLDHFRCKDHGAIFRIYDNGHIPKRYHYEASNRIGDFVIEGQPGTTFYALVQCFFKNIGRFLKVSQTSSMFYFEKRRGVFSSLLLK